MMDRLMSLRMASALALVTAMSESVPMPVASGKSTNLYRGRICGRDNGKPQVRYQPRNSPCVCGSGKKAKKCCVVFPSEGE